MIFYITRSYFLKWALAFAFTQIVEVPIYQRILRVRFWPAFGASLITHPIFWFVAAPTLSQYLPYWHMAAACELTIPVIEALYLALFFRCKVHMAFAGAFVANAASFGLGVFANWAFGFP